MYVDIERRKASQPSIITDLTYIDYHKEDDKNDGHCLFVFYTVFTIVSHR